MLIHVRPEAQVVHPFHAPFICTAVPEGIIPSLPGVPKGVLLSEHEAHATGIAGPPDSQQEASL
jgi:hypothetical protein